MERSKQKKTLTTSPADIHHLPHLYLEAVTNVSLSALLKIRKYVFPPKKKKENPAVSLPKNRSTASVNQKEDTLALKQRRGDSFIDLCFSNSIFKKKETLNRVLTKKNNNTVKLFCWIPLKFIPHKPHFSKGESVREHRWVTMWPYDILLSEFYRS